MTLRDNLQHHKNMSNRKYHFVKFSGGWYLKPETVQDIIDHFNTVVKGKFIEGIEDFNQSICVCKNSDGSTWIYRAHPETDWNAVVTSVAAAKGQSWIQAAHELENKTYQDRLKYFGIKPMYLANGFTYCMLKDEPEYEDEQWLDEIMYPICKFDIDKVRYIQWPDGKHWYAKIDDCDIVDGHGNQKWNTKEEAEQAVRKYFESL